MSHITKIDFQINDLDAVKAMCKEHGWEFLEGQKQYVWYGRYVGDTPMPEGMTEADLGKCDHAIAIPGCTYTVGLRKGTDGKYSLAFDYWWHGGLQNAIGRNAEKLKQAYGVAKAEIAARKQGFNVQRVAGKNGAIKLVMTGGRI